MQLVHGAFINEVDAKRENQLTIEEADILTRLDNDISEAIGCI